MADDPIELQREMIRILNEMRIDQRRLAADVQVLHGDGRHINARLQAIEQILAAAKQDIAAGQEMNVNVLRRLDEVVDELRRAVVR